MSELPKIFDRRVPGLYRCAPSVAHRLLEAVFLCVVFSPLCLEPPKILAKCQPCRNTQQKRLRVLFPTGFDEAYTRCVERIEGCDLHEKMTTICVSRHLYNFRTGRYIYYIYRSSKRVYEIDLEVRAGENGRSICPGQQVLSLHDNVLCMRFESRGYVYLAEMGPVCALNCLIKAQGESYCRKHG